uniref:Uncharacterized protein n=1 Tax=Strigamia maritima TaxID=126957 RepID=T1IK82_STRMM
MQKNCRRKKDEKPERTPDPSAAVSGISVFSNTSYYSASNSVQQQRAKRKNPELNTVQFQVPEKCMYILWQRQPKKKYVPINEYDIGEKYIWRDEICDRLKRGFNKSKGDKEFDEIGQAAVCADVLEAIDKVERNYFIGICDGSVIKISDKLYVWRVDVSHIEEEIALGPRSKLKMSKLISKI